MMLVDHVFQRKDVGLKITPIIAVVWIQIHDGISNLVNEGHFPENTPNQLKNIS